MRTQCLAVGPKKLGFLASRYAVSKGVREAATGVLRGHTRDVSQQIRISGIRISGNSGDQENRVGVLSTPVSGSQGSKETDPGIGGPEDPAGQRSGVLGTQLCMVITQAQGVI